MMGMIDTRFLRPMRASASGTGFSQAFLEQLERDAERRKPSVIRCGTTTTGEPILRCLLAPVRNRQTGEITRLSATVLHCPRCGAEHYHTIAPDGTGMFSTQKDARGNRLLVIQRAPCGLKYCLRAYEGEWATVNRQLAANATILRKQAEERQQARLALRQFMQRQQQVSR